MITSFLFAFVLKAAAAGAALESLGVWNVNVAPSGPPAIVKTKVRKDHDYLVRLLTEMTTHDETDLMRGSLKLFDSSKKEAVLQNDGSSLGGEPALFFHASDDEEIRIEVASKLEGRGGPAKLELYDSSIVKDAIYDIELSQPSFTETAEEWAKKTPNEAPIHNDDPIVFTRVGNLSERVKLKLIIKPTGAHPISAKDLKEGLTAFVEFEPNQTSTSLMLTAVPDHKKEGVETGTLEIDFSGLPSAVRANMELLKLRSKIDLEIRDDYATVDELFPQMKN